MRSDMEMLARAGMMAANTTMLIKPLAWAFWRRFLGTTPSWVKITPSTSPSSRAAMATAKESTILRGMEMPPFLPFI